MQKYGVEVDIIAINYITACEKMLFFAWKKKIGLNISENNNYSKFLCAKCRHHIADE
jgi:hypothetical protein